MSKLFVPLKNEPFSWFKSGEKTYELRKHSRGWNKKNVYYGREVELRRGYSTPDKSFGKIGQVIIGSLDDILNIIDYKKIIPVVNSKKEAKKMAINIMGDSKEFIAFEITDLGKEVLKKV